MSEKNITFEVGKKYRIRYKYGLSPVSRWAVMTFVSSDDSSKKNETWLEFDLRPLCDTKHMPQRIIISAEEVDKSEMPCWNKTWKEE